MPAGQHEEAQEALLEALDRLGIDARAGAQADADFVLKIDDQIFVVEVKSVVTASGADELIGHLRRRPEPAMVVANRIAEDAKHRFRLNRVNYFDRRGDVHLVAPPIVVDARVDVKPRARATAVDPLASQVAKEVAIACLLDPLRSRGIREVAAFIERVPSAVSKAMADLRAAALLTRRNEPLVPDLFEELAIRWRRHAVPLQRVPVPDEDDLLQSAWGEPDALGWALTDTRAAIVWGIPIFASGDYPPDFLVPTGKDLIWAETLLGSVTDPSQRGCTVAVAPVRLACMHRQLLAGERWPVANHIVTALDLAVDRARGVEALQQWNPQDVERVW